eukprot:TRINITY_DN3668_c0_g1_i1.p1 TRINITY_DN3668_c0_g1~~TRINITY_DN3668_c0_g1_i1.p1  ORF type:complete len:133 (-),score=21.78 TRINITY_DN3668_c0_g1_i1:96-494(-)
MIKKTISAFRHYTTTPVVLPSVSSMSKGPKQMSTVTILVAFVALGGYLQTNLSDIRTEMRDMNKALRIEMRDVKQEIKSTHRPWFSLLSPTYNYNYNDSTSPSTPTVTPSLPCSPTPAVSPSPQSPALFDTL